MTVTSTTIRELSPARRRSLRVGLLLPTRECALAGRDPDVCLSLAKTAERAGLDSVWAGESLLARPRVDPLVLLAAVAGATERLRVGTAVLLGALRHPVAAAHALASLDAVSGGRLDVGVGAGFPMPQTQAEFAAVGVPFDNRGARLDEAVAIWRQLWSADAPVSFTGRYHQFCKVDLAIRPAALGGPPVLLAGGTDTALRRCATSYDGWLPYPPDPAELSRGAAILEEAACDAGRPRPRVVTYLTVAVDADPTVATARLDRYAMAYYGMPTELVGAVQAMIAGTESEVTARVAAYAAAGADEIVLRLAELDDPQRALEQVLSAVLPAFTQGHTR